LVSQRPANGRFRLELARALFLTEAQARARHHFDDALSGERTLGEIQAVQEYLAAMDTRNTWRGQARIAMVPQSNPWRRCGQRHVDIGGDLVLPLPQVERATGVELGLGGTWKRRICPDGQGRVGTAKKQCADAQL
jgi:hypothetical protein